jgi:cell division septation protein DedD
MQLVMSAAERAAAARVISSTMASTKLPSAGEVTISEPKRPTKVKGRLASRRTAKATPAAVRTLPTSGAWRVQLGAFRVDGSAERLFARLAPRLPGKQPTYLPLGSMTRLLAGPYESKSAAQAACRALGSGQACFAVSPD